MATNDDIPGLVDAWLAANITHVLMTFITAGYRDTPEGRVTDVSLPLSDGYSMTLAFNELTPENQDLLVQNFVVGVSYGGAGAMPYPYSNTFDLPNSYYRPISEGGKGAEGLAVRQQAEPLL